MAKQYCSKCGDDWEKVCLCPGGQAVPLPGPSGTQIQWGPMIVLTRRDNGKQTAINKNAIVLLDVSVDGQGTLIVTEKYIREVKESLIFVVRALGR